MRRLSLLMVVGAVCAWSIEIPRIGYARDAQGRVVPVDGVGGNFIVGDALGGTATAFSWNGVFGICKTDSTIEWWDNTGARLSVIDAPLGEVVIGFGIQSALIYSKSAETLSEVKAEEWRIHQIPVTLSSTDEEVLALAGGRNAVDIAVRRVDGLFVMTFDRITGFKVGQVALRRSGLRALFLADAAIAGIDGTTFWIVRADGSEWSLDVGVTLTDLAWMGREWIQVLAADRQFGLRIRAGSEPVLYLLPQSVIE